MRLFVALNFTEEIKSSLLDAIDLLRYKTVSGSFTGKENLHMTLAFIGETHDISSAKDAVSRCSFSPFNITVGGCGRFGALWWAGIEKCPELTCLAYQVQDTLRLSGFPIERRPFKPHITLARQVQSNAPIELQIPIMTMPVDHISLMRSDRINGSLIYTELFQKNCFD